MPIFEYICRSCNETFEKLTSAQMRDSASCVHCGSDRTARKLSLTAPAQIKGVSNSGGDAGCGAPSCCGGGCGIPN